MIKKGQLNNPVEIVTNYNVKFTLCNPVVPVGHLLNARQFHSEVNL